MIKKIVKEEVIKVTEVKVELTLSEYQYERLCTLLKMDSFIQNLDEICDPTNEDWAEARRSDKAMKEILAQLRG